MSGNDAFTNILLHFDGSNGSTTITDDCAGVAAHTWTNHTGSIATAQSKFGGASYNCGSTGYVDTPDSADFALGSGDFTADLWFNRQGGDGARRGLCGQTNPSGGVASTSFTIELTAANVLSASVSDGLSFTTVTGTTTFTSTGWNHVAFVRTGNTLKLFVNGTQEGGDVSFSASVNDSARIFAVGRRGEFATLTWNGYIDEFRLSIGIARWTSNFTPPTAAYSTSFSGPSVRSVATGHDVGTSHVITMPASIVAGDLLVAIVSKNTTNVSTPGAGWSSFAREDGGGGSLQVFYRMVSGGASLTITDSSSTLTSVVYSISNASGLIEKATAASATSASPDPPSLTPSWGASDILWLAAFGATKLATAYPADFTNGQTISDSGVFITAGSAELQVNVGTLDPGVFTLSASSAWIVTTIAIKPIAASISISISATTSTALGGKTVGKVIAISATTATTLRRAVARTLAVAGHVAVTNIKRAGKAIAIAATTATAAIVLRQKLIAIGVSTSVSLRRTVSKTIAIHCYGFITRLAMKGFLPGIRAAKYVLQKIRVVDATLERSRTNGPTLQKTRTTDPSLDQ